MGGYCWVIDCSWFRALSKCVYGVRITTGEALPKGVLRDRAPPFC
jgi:hypothetical protein